MASLKCIECGYNMHNHGEPNGIEYVLIKLNEWNKCIEKHILTDQIELLQNNICLYMWKCPKCGSYSLTSEKNTDIFVLDNSLSISIKDSADKYIMFDDYTWDDLTELSTSLDKLNYDEIKHLYAKLSNSFFIIYDDDSYEHSIKQYKKRNLYNCN